MTCEPARSFIPAGQLDQQPEIYELYLGGVSEPPFLHGRDSSQPESALA
jgi:hypothetical protein